MCEVPSHLSYETLVAVLEVTCAKLKSHSEREAYSPERQEGGRHGLNDHTTRAGVYASLIELLGCDSEKWGQRDWNVHNVYQAALARRPQLVAKLQRCSGASSERAPPTQLHLSPPQTVYTVNLSPTQVVSVLQTQTRECQTLLCASLTLDPWALETLGERLKQRHQQLALVAWADLDRPAAKRHACVLVWLDFQRQSAEYWDPASTVRSRGDQEGNATVIAAKTWVEELKRWTGVDLAWSYLRPGNARLDAGDDKNSGLVCIWYALERLKQREHTRIAARGLPDDLNQLRRRWLAA